MFNSKRQGTRNTSYSFRYDKSDGLFHFTRTSQYVGPSSDGVNRVYNYARSINLAGTENRRTRAVQLVTNVPSEADNLIRRGVVSRWP